MNKSFIAIIVIFCNTCLFSVIKGQAISDTLEPASVNSPVFTLGGELRGRLRNFNVINFGEVTSTENDHDTYLNLRAIFDAELRLNKIFSLYTQLCSASTIGKDKISASDKDILGFSQLYADVHLNSIPVTFRVGRHLVSLGSGKIFGTSDGPNVTRTFDGIRSTFELGKTTGDIVFVTPVKNEIGAFDNKINTSDLIYGSYWTAELKHEHVLDLYFFGNHLKDILADNITANENRYTLGGRLNKAPGSSYYDAEATWQFGNHGTQKIAAFHISLTAGYSWQSSRFKPYVQIRGSIYSGSRDSTDQRLNLFRPVSARPPINNMVPFGPSNIILLVPEGDISITEKIGLNFRYYALWRYTANDGLYSTRLERMTRTPDKDGLKQGLFVTDGFNAQVTFDVNEHLNLSFTTGLFFPGEYILNTGNSGIVKNTQANFLIARYTF